MSAGKPLTPGAAVQRGLIVSLIVGIVVTAFMGAGLVFIEEADDDAALFVAVPAVVTLCLGLFVAYGAVLQRGCSLPMRLALIHGAIFALIATILSIWLMAAAPHRDVESLSMLAFSGFAVAIALAYTGALSQVRTKSWLIRGMCFVTGLSAWLAAALMTLLGLAVNADSGGFDIMIMLAIAMGLLVLVTLTGTIAVPIALVSSAAKKRATTESIDPRVQVHFGCPKCGERQTHKPGFIRCIKCGVSLAIEIEEPRCECGYLLYQLTGNTCPECGRTVMNAPGAV